MNVDANDLFPELTPPPGGLQALRRRLGEEPARRHRRVRRNVLAASLASVAFACVILLLTVPSPGPVAGTAALRIDADLNPALIRLGVAEPAAEPVTVPRDHRTTVAVERVDVDNPKIVFYRVSALPAS